MRALFALTAVLAVLVVPLVAESQCVNSVCPTIRSTTDVAMPTVDGRRWHVTFLYHSPATKADVQVASWLFGDPTLEAILRQAAFHAIATDSPAYSAEDMNGRSWKTFLRDRVPAVIVQDPCANRVYTAAHFPGPAANVNGSPIVPLPESGPAMAAGMRRAVVSWKGYVQQLGQLAVAKPKAEADFPPETIMRAVAELPKDAPEFNILERLRQRRQLRQQHWQEYSDQGDKEEDKEADVDVDVAADVSQLPIAWDQAPMPPVESAVANGGLFPSWLVVCLVGIAVFFLIAIRNDAVFGSLGQVRRHVFKSLR